jgi:hypothetical protein
LAVGIHHFGMSSDQYYSEKREEYQLSSYSHPAGEED